MSLPTGADLQTYLRIETDAEDNLLNVLVAQATAAAIAYLGRPLATQSRTWIDDGQALRAWSSLATLLVPVTPFDPTSLVITDTDGTALVADTDYRTPLANDALVGAMPGVSFDNPPYTLTADVGLALSTSPDYATVIEPTVSAAILDIAADLYQRRNPTATSESSGGGVSTSYGDSGLPKRAEALLASWRAVRVP